MNNDLIISNLKVSNHADYNEASADVDGDRVFFRAPLHFELDRRGEPFLGIALLEAMIRNADIRMEGSIPLSDNLYRRLSEIQTIYSCWNSNLSRINIYTRTDPLKSVYDNVGCFHSAGVDSLHTLLQNMSEISKLIMLSGFEVSGNTPESWLQSVEKQTAFARSIGKELIPIETNVKSWTNKRKITWAFAQGLILSSLGPLLRCKRIYIGSSHTYNELFPWGSHPLTDPMWSTESTEVIHYGAGFRRGEKIKDLCKNQNFLDNLRVCWRSTHANCGECSKCIRTMTALYLLGASSKAMPRLENLNKLKMFMQYDDESALTFLEDAILLARERQNNKILSVLKGYYRKYQLLNAIIMLDRYMLGGNLRKISRKLRNTGRPERRVKLRGPNPFDN